MKNEASMKALRDLIPECFKNQLRISFFFNTILNIDQRNGYLRTCLHVNHTEYSNLPSISP